MGSQPLNNEPQDNSDDTSLPVLSLPRLYELSELLGELRTIFKPVDGPIYLVGGAVRDIIQGRPIKDLDFVVPDGGIRVAFQVADRLGFPAYVLDRQRDSGRVVLEVVGNYLDFTSFRGQDLESDLRDRDFTINAMAIPHTAGSADSLIDPCGGLDDLNHQIIRQTHPLAISSDPVRALRAVRLAIELDFEISEKTLAAISSSASLMTNSSVERVRDELLKMLTLDRPDKALGLLERTGILDSILPEIAGLRDVNQGDPHHENVLDHTLSALRNLTKIEKLLATGDTSAEPRLELAQVLLSQPASDLYSYLSRPVQGGVYGNILLRLGVLFHDVGKGETRQVTSAGRVRFINHDQVGSAMTADALSRLKLSKEAIKHVSKIVAGHMRPLLLAREPRLTKRAKYRYYRDLGVSGLDCCLHSLADHLAIYPLSTADQHWQALVTSVGRLITYYYGRVEPSIRPQLILNGHDIIELFDLEAGPQIGSLLRILEEAQAAGEVVTRHEAITLLRNNLTDLSD